MIYRGPDFLAVVRFGSSPSPTPSPVNKMSLFLSLPVCCQSNLLMGEGEGVHGTKSYDRKTIKNSHLQVQFAQELTNRYAVCCIKKCRSIFIKEGRAVQWEGEGQVCGVGGGGGERVGLVWDKFCVYGQGQARLCLWAPLDRHMF